jgi:hypothetical protein
MFIKTKGCKFLVCLLSLIFAAGIAASAGTNVNADDKTIHVKTADELTAALDPEKIYDHIIIDESFDVPCKTASGNNGTSYFTVSRNMTIEGKDPNVTLTRTIAQGAENGHLQSILGICGDGVYDSVQVSLFKLTFDGGADFGSAKGMDRRDVSVSNSCLGGRSVIDVYYKATLNLEDGLTIQNGYCTYSLTSLTEDTGSGVYGGGVRVDWEETTGGGTVNVKAGACIKNCVAGSYGGGIGSYSHSRLNVYGGVIENCSARLGGGLGCTWRWIHSSKDSGTFRMYGGTIRNCSAERGGAILADGHPDYCSNALYGGTIDNCTATNGGSALALNGTGDDGEPSLSIAPYSENGPLFISNCPPCQGDTDPDTVIGDITLGYPGISLHGNTRVVTLESAMCSVAFKKFKDDAENMTILSISKGMSLGESFPADPTSNYKFIGWNTSPDGKGKIITKDFIVNENMIVYARWLTKPEFTNPEEKITLTYGELDKKVEIKNAVAPYGGEIRYRWIKLFGYDGYVGGNDAPGVANNSVYQFPKLPVGDYSFYCGVYNFVEGYGQEGKMSEFVEVKVNPKVLNITWSDTEFVYDGKNKVPKAVIKGVLEGDDVDVKVSGAKSEAGRYTATATLTGTDAGNYIIADGKDKCSYTIASVIKMPDLTGKNYEKAKTDLDKFLKDNGIKASISVGWAHNSDPAKNLTVAATTPAAGEPINADDNIILMVYEGYNPTISLNKDTASVICGSNLVLKATMTGASSAISWKSSDTKIASVDKNGKVTSKMAGTVTITASALGVSAKCKVTVLYKDVTNSKDFWYAPTNYLTAKGVVKGYANQTEFRPANDCTRAQMITFLYRLQGEPKTKSTTCKFTDVKSTEYFYKPVIWAVEQGITTVPSDKKFNPQTVCTRAMTVTFLWRMAGKPEPKTTKNPFPDVKKTDYFYKATLWASEMKILAGLPDGTFQPQGKCLRRQMVTFLYKYDKYVNGKG